MMMAPEWLEGFAKIALGLAFLCAGIITLDILRGNRQHMWIMDIVWARHGLVVRSARPCGLFSARQALHS